MQIEIDDQEAMLLIAALTEYTRAALPTVARIVPGMRDAIEVAAARAIVLRQKVQAALPPTAPPESPS